jgi:predicted permease
MTLARIARILRQRIRALAAKEAADSELASELAFHLDQMAAEFMAEGMDTASAQSAARRAFGNPGAIEEECRDQRRLTWLHDFHQDLRYAARMLRGSRAFTFTAVVSLALGIGGNTAILGVLDELHRGKLVFPEPDRLVIVRHVSQNAPEQMSGASFADYQAWKERSRTFESMGASLADRQDLADEDGTQAARIEGQAFTAGLFPTLGVTPLMGRWFTEEEGQPGNAATVIVISHRLWQTRFHGDPRIFQRTIRLNGRAARIVGVMPPDFHYITERAAYWTPLRLERGEPPGAGRLLLVGARLKPGVSLQEARAEMQAVGAQLAREFPARFGGWIVRLQPMRDAMFGWAKQSIYTLEAAVLLALLITCSNVAVLQLARTTARRPEMALRAALGASRGRIVRQLLAESLLLAILGGALGLLVAWTGFHAAARVTPQPGASHLAAVPLDLRVLLIALLTSVGAGMVFGTIPALAGSGSWRENAAPRSGPVRGALITAQIAVALVLLSGTGLLAKSFLRMITRDLHFNPAGLVSFEYRIPVEDYLRRNGSESVADPPPAARMQHVLESLRSLTDVTSAAGISYRPVNSFFVPRLAAGPEDGTHGSMVVYLLVTPGYFSTLQAQFTLGREISEQDTAGSAWVAVINETAARRFWPGENPLGKHLAVEGFDGTREVVGVIRDIPIRAAFRDEDPVIYTSYLQQPPRFHAPVAGMFGQMTFVLRGRAGPAALLAAARRAVAEIDPEHPVSDASAVEQVILGRMDVWASYVFALAVLAAIAAFLAAVGVYGVTAYAVQQRAREIAIRIALGARPPQLVSFLARWALTVMVAGTGIGIAGSLLVSRLIKSQLWEVVPNDGSVLAGGVLVLMTAATLACFLPVRRALQADPAARLRAE